MPQKVFRRLLEREALDGADAKAVAAAACRLLERLAQQLTPLIGYAGVTAVFGRSLHLARQQFPWLPTLSDDDSPFTDLQISLEQHDNKIATQVILVVLVTLNGLLTSFIGEKLASHFLAEVLSDDRVDGTTRETIT